MTAKPVGRRPGDPEQTRSDILVAARRRFGEVGFDRATVRSIAAEAGVDPALINHHFGSKRNLFAQAHELPIDPEAAVQRLVELPAEQRAASLTSIYLYAMLADGSPALSLLRTAATDETAATMLHEFITEVLVSRADELAPGPDAGLRLSLAVAQLVGVALGRGVLTIEPLTGASIERLVDLITPTVDRYLNPAGA